MSAYCDMLRVMLLPALQAASTPYCMYLPDPTLCAHTCRFPRPVHHRIPNFVNADRAADRLAQLPEFMAARTVKVNPDTPQKRVGNHDRRHLRFPE